MDILLCCYFDRLIVYLLLASLTTVYYVGGDYVLKVRTHSYSNPTEHCATCVSSGQNRNFGCCDEHNNTFDGCSGEEKCDTYFYYCLRQLQSRGTSCAEGETSHFLQDQSPINFTGDSLLGLSNPLILNGITNEWTGGIQLFMHVGDADGDLTTANDDDIIDVFHINIIGPIGSTSNRTSYKGQHRVAEIELSYAVLCARHYYGDVCENLNECLLNNVSCNGNGTCIDEQDSFRCACDAGFTGDLCQTSIVNQCANVNCSGNGQCEGAVNTFLCVCDPGFTGKLCETTNNEQCTGVNCSNDRKCVDGVNPSICICDPGFTGDACQINVNDCVGVNCSGNGQCEDGVNSFTCVCAAGYTGELCEHRIQAANSQQMSGAIFGGVVGVIVFLALLLLLVVVAVIVLRKRLKKNTSFGNGSLDASYPHPGENPVYGISEVGYSNAIPISVNPAQGTNDELPASTTSCPSITSVQSESGTEYELDNPIYGSQENETNYAMLGPVYATLESSDVGHV